MGLFVLGVVALTAGIALRLRDGVVVRELLKGEVFVVVVHPPFFSRAVLLLLMFTSAWGLIRSTRANVYTLKKKEKATERNTTTTTRERRGLRMISHDDRLV